MFLLILESFLCRCVRQPPLNSIMFLLILLADLEYHLVRQIFKFHYVSINSAPVHPSLLCPKSLNSIMFLLIPQPFRDRAHNVYPFKFHYVSINSCINNPVIGCSLNPLNSIMFLLIPFFQKVFYKFFHL